MEENEYNYEISEDLLMSYAESRLMLISKILIILGFILALAGIVVGLIAASNTWHGEEKILFVLFGILGGALTALPYFAAAFCFKVVVEQSMAVKEIRDKLNASK